MRNRGDLVVDAVTKAYDEAMSLIEQYDVQEPVSDRIRADLREKKEAALAALRSGHEPERTQDQALTVDYVDLEPQRFEPEALSEGLKPRKEDRSGSNGHPAS